MRDGYILLHRQGITPDEWKTPERTLAWIDLLTLTNFENGIVTVSYGFLATRWRVGKSTVFKWMAHWIGERQLERTGERDSERNGERFFVVNYAKYQKLGERVGERQGERKGERNSELRYTVSSIPSGESRKKNPTYDAPLETKNFYEFLDGLCKEYGLENKINMKGLNIQVQRYREGMNLREQGRLMVTWLIDHKKRDVSTMRVANWLKTAREINKRKENQNLERLQGKKDLYIRQRMGKPQPVEQRLPEEIDRSEREENNLTE